MKKYIFLVALSALALTSCSDFLDVQSEGDNTTTNYFTNDQQAISAVAALYQGYQQEAVFGRNIFWEQAAACDVVWGRSRSYSTLATLAYTGDESPLKDVWGTMYTTMARANWVISKLLKKTSLTDIEKRSLGEAYFMRGFSHFYIAYRYGTASQGVPFVRYEDYPDGYDYSIPPQQASVVDNYKFIIEDMDKAIQYLPRFESYDADNQGRAHQAAAVGFKAKVYAYWATWDESQWKNVIEQVNLLETSYGRGLASTFAQLFSDSYADFWTNEYIWTIPGRGGSNGGGSEFPGVVLENKGWGKFNGWGQNKPSYDIYEEMMKDGAGNARLKRSILEYGQEFQFFGETRKFYSSSDIESGFMINKFTEPFKYKDPVTEGAVNANGDWPTVRLNMPVLRFADLLLLRAEAYLMTNQADKAAIDINRIRNRSGIASLDHTATMEDLYHERRCELAFEFSDHLFDLKRWARSSNATIKALALKELNSHPRVRHYTDRSNPNSICTVGDYQDYKNKNTYQDYMMVFPYPSEQIANSTGKLKQNSGYSTAK